MYSYSNTDTVSVSIFTAYELKGKSWARSDSNFWNILLSENGNFSYTDTGTDIPMGRGMLILSPTAEHTPTLTFSDKFRGVLVRVNTSFIISEGTDDIRLLPDQMPEQFIPLSVKNVSKIIKYYSLLTYILKSAPDSEFSGEELRFACMALLAASRNFHKDK